MVAIDTKHAEIQKYRNIKPKKIEKIFAKIKGPKKETVAVQENEETKKKVK